LIYCGNGPTTIIGGSGPETIHGGTGNLIIIAGTGPQQLVYGGNADAPGAGGGQSLITADAGSTLIQDSGVKVQDTVVGFDEVHGDRISFSGENQTAIAKVVATSTVHDGSTTITLPDASTITLVGISHIDANFFK